MRIDFLEFTFQLIGVYEIHLVPISHVLVHQSQYGLLVRVKIVQLTAIAG